MMTNKMHDQQLAADANDLSTVDDLAGRVRAVLERELGEALEASRQTVGNGAIFIPSQQILLSSFVDLAISKVEPTIIDDLDGDREEREWVLGETSTLVSYEVSQFLWWEWSVEGFRLGDRGYIFMLYEPWPTNHSSLGTLW
jgi:hypothetical protein